MNNCLQFNSVGLGFIVIFLQVHILYFDQIYLLCYIFLYLHFTIYLFIDGTGFDLEPCAC
jgi:hypothetical protein